MWIAINNNSNNNTRSSLLFCWSVGVKVHRLIDRRHRKSSRKRMRGWRRLSVWPSDTISVTYQHVVLIYRCYLHCNAHKAIASCVTRDRQKHSKSIVALLRLICLENFPVGNNKGLLQPHRQISAFYELQSKCKVCYALVRHCISKGL